MTDYSEFLDRKTHYCDEVGFDPIWVPDFLFDFQKALVEWATRMGRSAIFADCGTGKTPMQLVWAENVCRKTDGNVIIVTPLAVSHQTVREGEKFGIECSRSNDGKVAARITVTNYERLHLFDPDDFAGVVCDESSILKNFDGKRRAIITDFMRKRPYRLLCTATAAPNDYIELGTSSEALGVLGHMDMLTRFFKNQQGTIATNRYHGDLAKWRFKKHAEDAFWRWVCSWSRAMRRPSDLGFDDGSFILPELIESETIIENTEPPEGELFVRPAVGLHEQRKERRATIKGRCEMVAEKVDHDDFAVVWCHLNDEGNLLERLIPDAVQVSGADSDEKKEETLCAFGEGKIRVLVTKSRIGGFGLNWQHCAHMTFFPSHSYEQLYQSVRRCWRFGQERSVTVDIITTPGEIEVLKNLHRKSKQAGKMFDALVANMNDSMKVARDSGFDQKEEVPAWL
jgi:hypothetical protein